MWKFSFDENGQWLSYTDKCNAQANAALNANPGKHDFYIEHWSTNSYRSKNIKYYVDVRAMTQVNQEANYNNTCRNIKVQWSEAPWFDFHFKTWARVGNPRAPQAAGVAATSPPATHGDTVTDSMTW